jgi:hypothetical protein
MYKDPARTSAWFRQFAEAPDVAGGGGSTKKKFFPTDEDAMAAGLVPISHKSDRARAALRRQHVELHLVDQRFSF